MNYRLLPSIDRGRGWEWDISRRAVGVIAVKQKILIMEDDFNIQNQLQTLLAGNDYEVTAVNDFTAVIQIVKSFAPHLILLDIKLPEKDGFTICSQIRKNSIPFEKGIF